MFFEHHLKAKVRLVQTTLGLIDGNYNGDLWLKLLRLSDSVDTILWWKNSITLYLSRLAEELADLNWSTREVLPDRATTPTSAGRYNSAIIETERLFSPKITLKFIFSREVASNLTVTVTATGLCP